MTPCCSSESTYHQSSSALHADLSSEERNSQKCAEYFKRLKDNEDLLTGVLANLTIRMRSCHNALNSKVHLPEAVFNKIMTEVVRETAPRYRLFLGQICSHWRKRVLGTRNLWSAIDLRWKKLSAEYLRRSHPLPIDVDFQPLTFLCPRGCRLSRLSSGSYGPCRTTTDTCHSNSPAPLNTFTKDYMFPPSP